MLVGTTAVCCNAACRLTRRRDKLVWGRSEFDRAPFGRKHSFITRCQAKVSVLTLFVCAVGFGPESLSPCGNSWTGVNISVNFNWTICYWLMLGGNAATDRCNNNPHPRFHLPPKHGSTWSTFQYISILDIRNGFRTTFLHYALQVPAALSRSLFILGSKSSRALWVFRQCIAGPEAC